jgi:hypothetical protein
MQLLERRSASFILRLWWEPDRASESPSQAQWRGSIEHVDSGDRRFFLDLREIEPFVRRCLVGLEGGSPTAAN